MYTLDPLPPPIEGRPLDLLRQAEPATIGHFLHTGFMEPAIRGPFPDIRVAGTAVTVRAPGADGVMVHHAVGKARPGRRRPGHRASMSPAPAEPRAMSKPRSRATAP